MTRQQRTAHARETAQADQAAADRPAASATAAAPRQAAASPGPAAAQPRQAGDKDAGTAGAAMRWRDRAGDIQNAVDAERRQRREPAVASRPEPAPLMRDALRRHSMLRVPDEDSCEEQGTPAGASQDRP